YYTVNLPVNLLLTAGLAYDEEHYPKNYESMPLSSGDRSRSEFGRKGALIWTPLQEVTVRAAYAKSLGGITIDQTYLLEPTQLAGFDQSFRDIMPVLPVGPVSAPGFEIFGGATDLNFKTRTYFTVQGEVRRSDADKDFGLFQASSSGENPAISMRQRLD